MCRQAVLRRRLIEPGGGLKDKGYGRAQINLYRLFGLAVVSIVQVSLSLPSVRLALVGDRSPLLST